MNYGMNAIIKKDLRGITSNKQLFTMILIVPLVFTVVLPSVFILLVRFMPEEAGELKKLMQMLPLADQTGDFAKIIINLVINNIMPIFFLIIPIMASSVMGACSFVGEKEQHTLETLLYCPLSVKQIFRSKVFASFLLSMMVSFGSFILMFLVVGIETVITQGSLTLPSSNWLVIMFLVAPAISLIAITLIVRSSAKAQNVMEAQQRAVFLIFPLLALIVGQFAGLLLVNVWILLALGVAAALLALLLMKKSMGKWRYEMLLK